MKVSHGKVHDYLGMKLDFTKPGTVKVTMIAYVHEIVAKFAKFNHSAKTANSPATNHLFQVNDTAEHLDDAKAAVFHCMTAKALFLTKWAWPDILTAMEFLTT